VSAGSEAEAGSDESGQMKDSTEKKDKNDKKQSEKKSKKKSKKDKKKDKRSKKKTKKSKEAKVPISVLRRHSRSAFTVLRFNSPEDNQSFSCWPLVRSVALCLVRRLKRVGQQL
jgi:hypothetical protein